MAPGSRARLFQSQSFIDNMTLNTKRAFIVLSSAVLRTASHYIIDRFMQSVNHPVSRQRIIKCPSNGDNWYEQLTIS